MYSLTFRIRVMLP